MITESQNIEFKTTQKTTQKEITEDGIKYHLARLQELGILRRIGGRKLGHWAFIEKA